MLSQQQSIGPAVHAASVSRAFGVGIDSSPAAAPVHLPRRQRRRFCRRFFRRVPADDAAPEEPAGGNNGNKHGLRGAGSLRRPVE
jgi:hypothetical protein